MPETPAPQSQDAGNFENAVAEMKRLEAISLKPPEAPPSYTAEPLFSGQEGTAQAATDYKCALHEALRIEKGLRQSPAATRIAVSPVQMNYAEQKRRREEEELRRMQEKFSKLDAEGKFSSTPTAKPTASSTAKPVSEEERLQVMRSKLAGLVKKKQGAQQDAPAVVRPPAYGEREQELKERLAKKIKAIKEREKKPIEPSEGKDG